MSTRKTLGATVVLLFVPFVYLRASKPFNGVAIVKGRNAMAARHWLTARVERIVACLCVYHRGEGGKGREDD